MPESADLITVALGIAALLLAYLVNNPRATAAIRFAVALLGSIKEYRAAIADGTVTPAEEAAIGRATVDAYQSVGPAWLALVETGWIRTLLRKADL
jgi:hypothetical protein